MDNGTKKRVAFVNIYCLFRLRISHAFFDKGDIFLVKVLGKVTILKLRNLILS